jgi:uncharacterized membrane protein
LMYHRLSQTTGLQRLTLGAFAGASSGLVPWPIDAVSCALVGWCVGVGFYLTMAWFLAERFDADQTRSHAQSLDQPDLLILACMLTVIGASLAAIAMLLQQVRQMDGAERLWHIALGLVSLACSWLMIHTLYAFHYAHCYYQDDRSAPGKDEEPLDFPGGKAPAYFDFLYYAMVVGMTSQVSDVPVRSREMRRITLAHSVLSFAFNMLVLALSINVVASSMQ